MFSSSRASGWFLKNVISPPVGRKQKGNAYPQRTQRRWGDAWATGVADEKLTHGESTHFSKAFETEASQSSQSHSACGGDVTTALALVRTLRRALRKVANWRDGTTGGFPIHTPGATRAIFQRE
jgi:hypothetical protein